MVKHIVFFNFKDKLDIARAKAAIISMRGKIAGMLSLEVGEDFTKSARSYDFVLITTHTDKEALNFYQAHPLHQPVKKLMSEIRESSAAVDFEI